MKNLERRWWWRFRYTIMLIVLTVAIVAQTFVLNYHVY